jgi:hypothetical protein
MTTWADHSPGAGARWRRSGSAVSMTRGRTTRLSAKMACCFVQLSSTFTSRRTSFLASSAAGIASAKTCPPVRRTRTMTCG